MLVHAMMCSLSSGFNCSMIPVAEITFWKTLVKYQRKWCWFCVWRKCWQWQWQWWWGWCGGGQWWAKNRMWIYLYASTTYIWAALVGAIVCQTIIYPCAAFWHHVHCINKGALNILHPNRFQHSISLSWNKNDRWLQIGVGMPACILTAL